MNKNLLGKKTAGVRRCVWLRLIKFPEACEGFPELII
jgi:hypothetical protein